MGRIIALAGNPNVGKSTVFNGLTGLHQHTGNWPGKTVLQASGQCVTAKETYTIIDLPGTYSLMAHSAEEEVARNFLCFEQPDIVVAVCDATCLERSLNLVLQILEITPNVILCVNLIDEAAKKGIRLDLPLLSQRLGIPVIGTVARSKKSLQQLKLALDSYDAARLMPVPPKAYSPAIENAVSLLEPPVKEIVGERLHSHWLCVKLLEQDSSLLKEIDRFLEQPLSCHEALQHALSQANALLAQQGIESPECYKDQLVSSMILQAELLCQDVVTYENQQYTAFDRRMDRLLTSRLTGFPVMLLLLAFLFWLTIAGANYPSKLLSQALFRIQDSFSALFLRLQAPQWLHGALVLGVYRVSAWVVSVMLPPMAIFFPLFTLLEDAGYLPRIAYNLDRPFQRCCACGKQALCMCMGFGCNAVGVIGCRIIDSPRERLLAILTNSFVPCNGRFPTLIALLTMFLIGSGGGIFSSLLSALLLTVLIVSGIGMTFLITRLLSQTLLKGIPSSFTLELPPYRRPQIGKVIIHSVLERTLFVLGRAVCVAAPAGLIIWLMANGRIGESSILYHCSSFLDPFARLMGLDGTILLAFLLGFPANEIVIPIMIMVYTAQGSLTEFDSLLQLKQLFIENGWTWATAVSTMLFSLNHWPCSTTLLTIHKETKSLKWTVLAALLPTAVGICVCMLFTAIVHVFIF